MKTGTEILEAYNAQSSDSTVFKTLAEMIDDNTRTVIEEAAVVCETAPGGNRATVARAIRKLAEGL